MCEGQLPCPQEAPGHPHLLSIPYSPAAPPSSKAPRGVLIRGFRTCCSSAWGLTPSQPPGLSLPSHKVSAEGGTTLGKLPAPIT